MKTNVIRIAILILVVFFCVSTSSAQEAAPLKERVQFDKLVAEWKPILQQMYNLRKRFHEADCTDLERERLRTKFNELLEESFSLSQQITDTGVIVLSKEPEKHPDVGAFLMKSLEYYQTNDLYEEAFRLSLNMLSQKLENDFLIRTAAFSSLYSNNFDAAAQLGPILFNLGNRRMTEFDWNQSQFQHLEYWQKEWPRELELREQEKLADDLPRVVLQTTKGEIEIELFENEAPNTVANFIFLVEHDFYTNLDFHRVIRGFMAQGGGSELIKTETNLDGTLKKRGNGGPGYSIPDELGPKSRKHFRGSVSMANSGPDSGGSQFFIMLRPNAELDGKHTVFGRVIRGMDVVCFLLPRTPEKPDPYNQSDSEEVVHRREEPGIEMPDKILSAKVVRKRRHEYSPRGLKPDKFQKPPFPKMPGMEDKPGDILDDNWDVFEEIKKGMP